MLIELPGLRLLTDPLLGRHLGFLRRVTALPPPSAVAGVDAVLISHCHADHLDRRSLWHVGRDVRVVAPAHAVPWLRHRGLRRITAVRPGDRVRLGDAEIEVTHARHDGRRWPLGRPAEAVGYLVEGVYFAGDTDLYPAMESLADRVDVALLPIAGWGPELGPGHLDPARAATAAALTHSRMAIPIHWGTLAPFWTRPSAAFLSRPAHAFAAEAANAAPDVEVRVLRPLERIEWCRHPDSRGVPAVASAAHGRDHRSHG